MPKLIMPYIAPVLCCSVCGVELRRLPQENRDDVYEHRVHPNCPVGDKFFVVYDVDKIREILMVRP